MQTRCPECASTIVLDAPGTAPDVAVTCQGCGRSVRPGAFACPGCDAALQVERSLLPPDGARGNCPACNRMVLVPGFAPEEDGFVSLSGGSADLVDRTEATAITSRDEPAAEEDVLVLEEAEEPVAEVDTSATMKLGADDLLAATAGADAEATMRLDAGSLPSAPDQEEDAEATMRLDAGSLPSAPEREEDAGATMRLSPDSLPPMGEEDPLAGEVEEPDAGSTLRLDADSLPDLPEPLEEPPLEATAQDDLDAGATLRLDAGSIPAPPAPEPPAPQAASPAAGDLGVSTDSVPLATPSMMPPPPRPSRPPRMPSTTSVRKPARRGGRGRAAFLGLFLGLLLAGGGSYLASFFELLTLPPLPFAVPGLDALPEAVSWSILLGGTGALIGALLGSLLGGGSRR